MPGAELVEPPPRPLRARLAWFACGLALALLAAGLLIPAGAPAGLVSLAPVAVWAAASAVVGSVVAARRPENPIGWLLSASGTLVGLGLFAGQYAYYALVTRPDSLPGGQAMLWLAGWPFDAGLFLVLFLLLLFPTGRLPSARWRPVARFALAVYLADLVGRAFAPGPLSEDEFGPLPNPLGIEASAALAPVLTSVVTTLLLVAALAAVASLLARLRRARGVERQQLKWFCYAAGLFATSALVAVAWPSVGGHTADTVTIMLGLTALPVAIGIAVLRYRLYDIDRLINRTLVYGLLTTLLGGGYAGLVLLLGHLFGGIGDTPPTWAVAGATLAAWALFQPARRRIQQTVDRHFNRRRYDAVKTVQTFSTRLRDQVDLDTLSVELVAVVDRTMQPTTTSLWLRPPASRQPSGSRSQL